MATSLPRKLRSSCSSRARLPMREGSRQFKSKTRLKSQCSNCSRRKLVIRGAPRMCRLWRRRPIIRPSTYRHYGSSSQTARPSHPPLVVHNPYQELERSVFSLSKLAISDTGSFHKRGVQLSSDSSEECIGETNEGGGGDLNPGGRGETPYDSAQEERSKEGQRNVQDTGSFHKRGVQLSSDSSEECIGETNEGGGGDLNPGGRGETPYDSAQEERSKEGQRNVQGEDPPQTPFAEIIRLRHTLVMETIARNVSPTRRLQHLRSKGYLNHDYSQHERTTSDMENVLQGNKKGIQNLYFALGVRPDRNNGPKLRLPLDVDFFDSSKCSKRPMSRI